MEFLTIFIKLFSGVTKKNGANTVKTMSKDRMKIQRRIICVCNVLEDMMIVDDSDTEAGDPDKVPRYRRISTNCWCDPQIHVTWIMINHGPMS